MIPAIIGALGSIGATVLNNHLQKYASDRSYSLQRDYSTYLLKNQTQQHVGDARRAGLNPAFMNGSQLVSTPPPPSYDTPQYQVPDFSNLFLLAKQSSDIRLQDAQGADLRESAEQKRLDNEQKKIELARERAQDHNVAQYFQENSVDYDDMSEWFENHPNELPESIVIGDLGATGVLNAKERISNYERLVSDVDVQKIRNNLETLVTSGQISDAKVLRALEQMPVQTMRKLVADTKNVLANTQNLKQQGKILEVETVTKQLEQKIMQDNHITNYVDKLFDKDFSMRDLVKVLVKAAIQGFVK